MTGTAAPHISIEKYIDRQICGISELTGKQIEALSKVYDQRFIDSDKAVALKAQELNTQIQSLVRELDALAEVEAHSVNRDIYDARWLVVDSRFTVIEKWQANIEGRIIATTFAISIVIPLVILLINYFLTGTK